MAQRPEFIFKIISVFLGKMIHVLIIFTFVQIKILINRTKKIKFILCLLYSGTLNESSFLDSHCYNLKLKYILLGFGSLMNHT